MSHPTPVPDGSLGASFRWLVWGIAGLGALLVISWTLREWFSAYTPSPASLIVGFVLLVATVPSAKIKRFQVGPRVGLNIEFHSAPPIGRKG